MGGMVPEEFFLSGAAGSGAGLPMMGGGGPAAAPPMPPPEPVQPVVTAPMPRVDVPLVPPPEPGIFGLAGTPQLMGGPKGDTLGGGFNPNYVVFHDYGDPASKIGSFNPYNALVMPDGSVRYRDPANPYGSKAPHSADLNPNSVGLAYGGPVGSKPTPEGLASLQSEFDKIRSQYPDIKGVGHGQAFNNHELNSFPYRATNDPKGRDVVEATWRQDLTGPVLAPTQRQATMLANNSQFPRAPVAERGLATVAGLAPPPVVPPQVASNAPIVGRGASGAPPGEVGGPPPVYPQGPPYIPPPSAQPGGPGGPPPAYNPPPIYAATPEPGGIVESYTRGSPIYSQHGMGPNELPDGSFWKAQDFATGGAGGLPSWMSRPAEVAEAPSSGRVAESTAPPTYAQDRGRVSDAVRAPAQYDEPLPWTPKPEGTTAQIAAPIKDPAKSEKTWAKALGKGLEVAGKVIKDKPTPKLVQVEPPRPSTPFIGAPMPRNVDMFGRPRYRQA